MIEENKTGCGYCYVCSFGWHVCCFVCAKPQAHGLFMASVGMTIMIPLLLYAYTIIYRVIHPEVHKEDEMYEDMEKYDDGGGLNGENNGGEPDSENNAGGNNDDNRDKGN